MAVRIGKRLGPDLWASTNVGPLGLVLAAFVVFISIIFIVAGLALYLLIWLPGLALARHWRKRHAQTRSSHRSP